MMTTTRRPAKAMQPTDIETTGPEQTLKLAEEAGQQDRDQVPDHGSALAGTTSPPEAGGAVPPSGGRSAEGGRRWITGGDADGEQSRTLRRRPRLRGGRRYQYSVRLSEEEQVRVEAAARSAAMTVPNLLAETMLAALDRHGQLNVAERHALFGELLAVRRLLKALSNNVNQLAAAANSTGQLPPELEETMRALTRTINRLDAVLDPIEARHWGRQS